MALNRPPKAMMTLQAALNVGQIFASQATIVKGFIVLD